MNDPRPRQNLSAIEQCPEERLSGAFNRPFAAPGPLGATSLCPDSNCYCQPSPKVSGLLLLTVQSDEVTVQSSGKLQIAAIMAGERTPKYRQEIQQVCLSLS